MKVPDPLRTEKNIDWSLTTWRGSRREQLRRWAELPLERAIMALEEMEDLYRRFQAVQSKAPEVAELAGSYGRDAVRYVLDSTELPLMTETLPVAEAARRALMGIHGRLTEENGVRGRSGVLSGKDEQNKPLVDHRHAYYLT
ncbi:MAG: hypothetical protein HY650_03900 [Acidobacteria bacterium]|nr:hypothetical protein [Acidobacteriota bacterium]